MERPFKFLFTLPVLLAFFTSVAQTPLDTVKTGKTNDPMVVNPGRQNDAMVVKPAVPNDKMAVMTDTGFISRNILDNMLEIQLAKLGRDTGTSGVVKKVAVLMITDHTAMLNDLKVLAKKHGITGVTDMPKSIELPPLQVQKGSDFNATWASAMLTMHSAKAAELEKFQAVTRDADIKTAIGRALPKITIHREMLSKIPGAKLTEDPNAVTH
jgi:predicted outer membrane protein